MLDTLPGSLTYLSGTTTLDGAPAPETLISSGLSLGSLVQNQERLIRFRAKVAGQDSFASFPAHGTNRATLQLNALSCQTNLSLTVNCQLGGATCVKTGVSSSWFAMILSLIATTFFYFWHFRYRLLGYEFNIPGLRPRYSTSHIVIISLAVIAIVTTLTLVLVAWVPLTATVMGVIQ